MPYLVALLIPSRWSCLPHSRDMHSTEGNPTSHVGSFCELGNLDNCIRHTDLLCLRETSSSTWGIRQWARIWKGERGHISGFIGRFRQERKDLHSSLSLASSGVHGIIEERAAGLFNGVARAGSGPSTFLEHSIVWRFYTCCFRCIKLKWSCILSLKRHRNVWEKGKQNHRSPGIDHWMQQKPLRRHR